MFFRAFQSAAKNGQFAKMYYNNTLQVEQTFNADETVSKIVDNVTDNVYNYTYDRLGNVTEYEVVLNDVVISTETVAYDDIAFKHNIIF